MKYFILLILLFSLTGCFTGTLTSLGKDSTTIIYQEMPDGKRRLSERIIYPRNPWAYPMIIIGYPVALSLDIITLPFLLIANQFKDDKESND